MEPTVPPLEEPRRVYVRPLICPEGWIEQNQDAPEFDKSSFKFRFSEEEKKQQCKDFVERNRDKLWKYDTKYLDKTPRTVYKELSNEYFYLNKMTHLHHREVPENHFKKILNFSFIIHAIISYP